MRNILDVISDRELQMLLFAAMEEGLKPKPLLRAFLKSKEDQRKAEKGRKREVK